MNRLRFIFHLTHRLTINEITALLQENNYSLREKIDYRNGSFYARGGIETGVDRELVRAVREATVNGGLSLDLNFTSDIIDAVNEEPKLSRLYTDLTDDSGANAYRYNVEKALMELGIHETDSAEDDVVMLCGEYEE